MNELPEGWTVESFSQVASYTTGRTPARANPAYWAKGERQVPWVAISGMEQYGTIVETAESVSALAFESVFRERIVPAGTLIMSFKLTIGRVATLGIPACHNEAIISIFPREGVDLRAAVAYASRDNMKLFGACAQHLKPLEFFGRYDHTEAVDPVVLKRFLDKASPNYDCKLVPDILHAKVIWWVEAGAYIGSANLSDRVWISNIEADAFLPHDELVETGMERELLRFFEEVDDRARPLTKEIYQEQLRLADRRSELSRREYGLEQQFDKERLLPKNHGLVFVDTKRSSEKRFQKFEQDWNDTLQVMRSIASRVSAPGARLQREDRCVNCSCHLVMACFLTSVGGPLSREWHTAYRRDRYPRRSGDEQKPGTASVWRVLNIAGSTPLRPQQV